MRDDAAIGYAWPLSHYVGRRTAGAGAISGVMADLLRRVAERADTTAFRELYQTYGPRVKAFMMRQGTDAATAEDLAQETLFTVWRRASLYAADKGSAATWIFAIARNLALNLYRDHDWKNMAQAQRYAGFGLEFLKTLFRMK